MGKWTVEMSYRVGVSIENIEARTQQEAIKKAKEMVDDEPHWYMENVEFEQVNFVEEED